MKSFLDISRSIILLSICHFLVLMISDYLNDDYQKKSNYEGTINIKTTKMEHLRERIKIHYLAKDFDQIHFELKKALRNKVIGGHYLSNGRISDIIYDEKINFDFVKSEGFADGYKNDSSLFEKNIIVVKGEEDDLKIVLASIYSYSAFENEYNILKFQNNFIFYLGICLASLFFYLIFSRILESSKIQTIKSIFKLNLIKSKKWLENIDGSNFYEKLSSMMKIQSDVEENNKETLKDQIPSAIRREMLRNKKGTYQIHATLVHIDINQYTNASERDFLKTKQIMDDFYLNMIKILEKHNGYFKESKGDDLLFYFIDDECQNSSLRALFCLDEMLKKIDGKFNKIENSSFDSFIIKGIVHSGHITCTNQEKIDISGGNGLYKMEKIFKKNHIASLNHHNILITEEVCSQISDIFDVKHFKNVEIEGVVGQHSIFHYLINPTFSLEWIFNSKKFKYLEYFRSEENLKEIFLKINSSLDSLDFLNIKDILTSLSTLKPAFEEEIYYNSKIFKKEFFIFFENLYKRGFSDDQEYVNCSRVLNLVTFLFKDNFIETSQILLDFNFDNYPDTRVRSDAISILLQQPQVLEKYIYELKKNKIKNNRLYSSILVEWIKQDLNDNNIYYLRSMIFSDDLKMISSGIYTFRSVYHYYMNNNLGHHLILYPSFLELENSINIYKNSQDVSIKKQLNLALEMLYKWKKSA